MPTRYPDLSSRHRSVIREHPRFSSGLSFGCVTALVTYFAWVPDSRVGGVVPVLSIGAGLAHAIAGAALGPRLIDSIGTSTPARACLRGVQISLLAQLMFVVPFSLWVGASNIGHQGLVSHVAFTAFVGFFGFLAAGWALCVVSAGIALSLFWSRG